MRAGALRRAVAAVIVVFYHSWLLFPWVDGHQIVTRGLVSELAASTRPRHGLFRTGDMLVGLLVLGVAVAGRRRWRCTSRPGVLAWLVGLTGAGMVADGAINLTCSATMDAHCAATGSLAGQAWRDQVHTGTSVLYTVCLLASLALVALTGRGRLRRCAAVVFGVQVLANVVLALCDLLERPHHTWLQLVSITLTAGWLATLALLAQQGSGPALPVQGPGSARRPRPAVPPR